MKREVSTAYYNASKFSILSLETDNNGFKYIQMKLDKYYEVAVQKEKKS